jgi:hypothetical protein
VFYGGTPPAATTNIVFRIYTNGTASSMTCTIAGVNTTTTNTFAADTTSGIYFGGGTNVVSLMLSNTAGASIANVNAGWSIQVAR